MRQKEVLIIVVLLIGGFFLFQTNTFQSRVPIGTGFQAAESEVECSGFQEMPYWGGTTEVIFTSRAMAVKVAEKACQQSWSEKLSQLAVRCFEVACKVPPCYSANLAPEYETANCMVEADDCAEIRENFELIQDTIFGFSYRLGWRCAWTAKASFRCICYERPELRPAPTDVLIRGPLQKSPIGSVPSEF